MIAPTEMARTERPPRVFIVDDDAAIRSSLRLLMRSTGIPTKGFSTGESFLASDCSSRAGCVLLDIRMAGIGGIEVQRQLRKRGDIIPVIFLTAHGNVPMAVDAMQRGAFDFIEKPCREHLLIERVRKAFEQNLKARHQSAAATDALARIESLTPREREVFEMILAGWKTREMANALQLSVRTIETHRVHIMQKLNATSVADLVRMIASVRRVRPDTVKRELL